MATKKAATRKMTKASATPAKRSTTSEKKTGGANAVVSNGAKRNKPRAGLEPIKDYEPKKKQNLVSIKDHAPASSKPDNLVSIEERKKPYNKIPSISETKERIRQSKLVPIEDITDYKARKMAKTSHRSNKYNY